MINVSQLVSDRVHTHDNNQQFDVHDWRIVIPRCYRVSLTMQNVRCLPLLPCSSEHNTDVHR
jgi:hypothetical protein